MHHNMLRALWQKWQKVRKAVRREGCSAEDFEGLVQRNMAANCGMDYAFMADLVKAILSRESHLLRYMWRRTLVDPVGYMLIVRDYAYTHVGGFTVSGFVHVMQLLQHDRVIPGLQVQFILVYNPMTNVKHSKSTSMVTLAPFAWKPKARSNLTVLTGILVRVGRRTGGTNSIEHEQDGFLPSCRSFADDRLLY